MIPYGLTVPINSQCTLLGPYVVPAYDSTFHGGVHQLPIVTPIAAPAGQHGVFVMERLLDLAAHELKSIPRKSGVAISFRQTISVQERDHLSGFSAARI